MPIAEVAHTKTAVAYLRVSTARQAGADKSGIDRQEQALAGWQKAHPDFVIRERIAESISGHRANSERGLLKQFLDEARDGRFEPGTVLVIETFSRLSRADMQHCLALVLAIFEAGLGVSFCDWGNQILRSMNDGNGIVHQIAGAAAQAHNEWRAKKDRSDGAIAHRRRRIENEADGKSAVGFKPRGPGNTNPGYPFWLDVDKDGNWELLEDEVVWIKEMFRLAQEMGCRRIAERLQADGITQARSQQPINENQVRGLLRNRALLGERQNMSKNKAVGEPVKGVYPAVLTLEEWQEAQDAIKSRGHTGKPYGKRATGKRLHNLFEGSTFCAYCGSRVGVRENRASFSFNCKGREIASTDCNAPSLVYDEDRILNFLKNTFEDDERILKLFGDDTQRDHQLDKARKEVLKAQQSVAIIQEKIRKIEDRIKSAAFDDTPQSILLVWDHQHNDLIADLNRAQQQVNYAEAERSRITRRPSGKQALAKAQKSLDEFIASGRKNLFERQDFNDWFARLGLVMFVDKNLERGYGRIDFGVACRDYFTGKMTIFSGIGIMMWQLDKSRGRVSLIGIPPRKNFGAVRNMRIRKYPFRPLRIVRPGSIPKNIKVV